MSLLNALQKGSLHHQLFDPLQPDQVSNSNLKALYIMATCWSKLTSCLTFASAHISMIPHRRCATKYAKRHFYHHISTYNAKHQLEYQVLPLSSVHIDYILVYHDQFFFLCYAHTSMILHRCRTTKYASCHFAPSHVTNLRRQASSYNAKYYL